MKIEKFKKISGGRYKIFTDENEIILYEDVIIKYNLLSQKDIDLKLLGKLLNDNKYYEVYNLSIKYIETKMRSKYELIKYLEKKEFSGELIDKIVEELSNINLLNDINYIKAFVNDKINLSNMGPYKIKEELLKNKIDEYDIDNYLNNIDNNIWLDKIEKLIDKKISLNKNKSNFVFKKYIYNELKVLGYPIELIEQQISKIIIDDKENIEKEFNKALKKLNKKYSGDTLKYMIKNELIKKGFSYESIEESFRSE